MIDAIAVFLEVVSAGSLSKVARQRGIAVSSISRKIDTLEQELGFKLFHRTSRLLMLTDAGERFLPSAKNILLELDDAKNAMSALSADPKGLLTITAPASFGRLHVAPAITSFLKRYPQMEIDLHVSDEIIDLSAQRIDVAIRIGSLPDSDLVATKLVPFYRLTCASPDYIARYGSPESPQDLLKHNCLTTPHGRSISGFWCYASTNKGAPLPVQGSFRSNDTNALLQGALAGIGIIHLASWLVSDYVVSGQLISLFPNEPELSPTTQPGIHAVRMPGRSHAAKAQLLIAHLKEEFGEPAYWDKALKNFTSPGKK